MKPFYIADGIIQGILTLICTMDITHLFVFPGFSFLSYLIFILVGWQLFSSLITDIPGNKARYNRTLLVVKLLLLCDIGLLILLTQADKYGWLDIKSYACNGVFLAFVYYLLLPILILIITILTIRRSIIVSRGKTVSLLL